MNAPYRLSAEEMDQLAERAFASTLGEAGVELQARHYLLGRMASSTEEAGGLGEASMEAPDCGRGMALAEWEELSEPEQDEISALSAQIAQELIIEAVRHLVSAARSIGIDERQIPPDTVAIVSMTQAVWDARQKAQAHS